MVAETAMDTAVLYAMMQSVVTSFVKLAGATEAKRMLEMTTAHDRQSYRLVIAGLLRHAIRDAKYPIDAGAMRIVGIEVPDDVPDLTPVRSIELDEAHRMFAVCWDVDDGKPEVVVSVRLDNDDPEA